MAPARYRAGEPIALGKETFAPTLANEKPLEICFGNCLQVWADQMWAVGYGGGPVLLRLGPPCHMHTAFPFSSVQRVLVASPTFLLCNLHPRRPFPPLPHPTVHPHQIVSPNRHVSDCLVCGPKGWAMLVDVFGCRGCVANCLSYVDIALWRRSWPQQMSCLPALLWQLTTLAVAPARVQKGSTSPATLAPRSGLTQGLFLLPDFDFHLLPCLSLFCFETLSRCKSNAKRSTSHSLTFGATE